MQRPTLGYLAQSHALHSCRSRNAPPVVHSHSLTHLHTQTHTHKESNAHVDGTNENRALSTNCNCCFYARGLPYKKKTVNCLSLFSLSLSSLSFLSRAVSVIILTWSTASVPDARLNTKCSIENKGRKKVNNIIINRSNLWIYYIGQNPLLRCVRHKCDFRAAY